MLGSSLAITPFAALSRPVAGVRNDTLIVTLPGSMKGATECFEAICKVLPHALELIAGDSGEKTHAKLKEHKCGCSRLVEEKLNKQNSIQAELQPRSHDLSTPSKLITIISTFMHSPATFQLVKEYATHLIR
jgi:gephyrin